MIALTSLPCSSWPSPGMKKLASAAITLPVDPRPAMGGKVLKLPSPPQLDVRRSGVFRLGSMERDAPGARGEKDVRS